MGIVCRNCFQVADVIILAQRKLHLADNILVLLLKHLCINAVIGLACGIVALVLVHLVNKEQAQHFNALVEQLAFPLKMRKDRFPNLDAAQLVLVHLADHISGKQSDTIQKFNVVIAAINLFHHIAILIFVQIAGVVIEVEFQPNGARYFAQAGFSLAVELDRCRRVCLGKIDAFQIDKPIRSGTAGFRNAFDHDFLDQTLIIGFHCIQPVDHVVDAVCTVGSRVAQGDHRVELFHPLFGLLALHRLRFINNQNRVRLCNNVNGPTGTELVQLHINTAGIFAFGIERLRIDDHDIDGTIRGKAVDFRQLCGVVDKEADLLAVLFCKVILCDLKRFIHTLTDGNTGHDHDKLTPAVMLVQLIHGLDIGVGFADTCFHLNGKVIVSLQLLGRLNLVGALDFLQVLQTHTVVQLWYNMFIAPACEACFHISLVNAPAVVDAVICGQVGLARKDVHHGFCGICLKFLVFELKFHLLFSLKSP